MWGEKLSAIELVVGEKILIKGARTSNKYGAMQLNVNSDYGEVVKIDAKSSPKIDIKKVGCTLGLIEK